MKVVTSCILSFLSVILTDAQISINGTYSQNFDSLGSASAPWTNNVTLPGWYASKGSANSTNYLGGSGTGNTGGLYSFGVNGVNPVTDRALGLLASGSATPIAFGVRFVNNTAFVQTNITISYTGEQWRNGGSAIIETNAFSFAVSSLPITNSFSAVTWTNFPALNFSTPTVLAGATSLDGNATTNRQVFTNIVLTSVTVQPGQEFFLRWVDTDNPGSDDGLAVDNLTVTFTTNAPVPPSITTQPQDQAVMTGNDAAFMVVAGGTPPFGYQWKSNNVSVAGATNDTFMLFSVTTNLSGSIYSVTITNAFGSTNSQLATLTVIPPPVLQSNSFKLVQYNVMGNFASDWSTNAPQVQAIGRELTYLNPDIITFNEIPNAMRGEMTNWGKTFLSGYNIVVTLGTGSDNAIRNAIASRFPIVRTNSWLAGVTLTNFNPAVTNGFTRDLFEAEIAVPGFPQPLHVFSVHLKSGTSSSDDAARRAAEASAVSNFFVTSFLTTNYLHPYILDGDMNEDIDHPATGSQQPIQRLISAPTGLQLTTPLNPITHSNFTHSIQGTLARRYDYIMPSPLLFSNIVSSQVFRTDLLTNFPPDLFSNDDIAASDHLPVVMVFNNPYDKPFSLTSFTRTNSSVTLKWQTVFGQPYTVEISTDLINWSTWATNLVATNYGDFTFTTNVSGDMGFFRVHRAP